MENKQWFVYSLPNEVSFDRSTTHTGRALLQPTRSAFGSETEKIFTRVFHRFNFGLAQVESSRKMATGLHLVDAEHGREQGQSIV